MLPKFFPPLVIDWGEAPLKLGAPAMVVPDPLTQLPYISQVALATLIVMALVLADISIVPMLHKLNVIVLVTEPVLSKTQVSCASG